MERTVVPVDSPLPSRVLLRYSALTRIRRKRLVLQAWRDTAASKAGFGRDSVLSVRLVMFYYRYLIGKGWTGLKQAKETRIRREHLREKAEYLGQKSLLKRAMSSLQQSHTEIKQEQTAAKGLLLKLILPNRLRVFLTHAQHLRRAASQHKHSLTRRALQSLYTNRQQALLERKKEIVAYRNYRKRGLKRCFGALKNQKLLELQFFTKLEREADEFHLGRLLVLRRVAFFSLEGNVLGRGYHIRNQLRVSQKRRMLTEWKQLVERAKSLERIAEISVKGRKSKIFSGLCSALQKQKLDHERGRAIQNKSEVLLKEEVWSCMRNIFQQLQNLKVVEANLNAAAVENIKRRTLGYWLDAS